MTEEGLYIEISDSGNYIRIEPIALIDYNSNLDWDKNWIKAKVKVKGGSFSGEYTSEFMTVDFKSFASEFSKLYDNLRGSASFHDIEGYLDLKITGDGIGHFEIKVSARDKPGYGNTLQYDLSIDQTQIPGIYNQLEEITKRYPVTGNLK